MTLATTNSINPDSPPRISRSRVRTTIDTVEPELKWCCKFISCLANHSASPTFGNDLLSFQVRLLSAIEKLEELYHEINREEKRLISRKLFLTPSRFKQRMGTLSLYSGALRRVLVISRALGDGFAWYFYERDRDLIDQHLKHQRQPMLPPKVGALGERLTLEKLQLLEGQFLIYHGITTFLRIGDISLIDLHKMRVASIGELKTRRVDAETIETHVSLLATGNGSFPKIKTSGEQKGVIRVPLPASMEDRRKRQAKAMQKALDAVDRKVHQTSDANLVDFHFEAFQKLIQQCSHRAFSWIKPSNGLVIGAIRTSADGFNKLSRTLLARDAAHPAWKAKDVPEWAIKILDPELSSNSICLGSICGEDADFVAPSVTFPVALWPITIDAMTALFLGQVIVITLFNPAHMWSSLSKEGFDVIFGDKGEVKTAVHIIEGKELRFENLEWFKRLPAHYLMTEECTLRIIMQFVNLVRNNGNGQNARIELNTIVHRSHWRGSQRSKP